MFDTLNNNELQTQLLLVDPPKPSCTKESSKTMPLRKYATIAGCIVLSPILIPACIVAYPFYYADKMASMKRINQANREFEEDKRQEKAKREKHEWRLNNEWQYRLSQNAPRISQLTIWQKYILECDQYERMILQISEANDVPYEIWSYIRYDDFKNELSVFLLEQMKVYDTDEYDKERCVKYVYDYICNKYAAFKNTSIQEAEEHMKNIVTRLSQTIN